MFVVIKPALLPKGVLAMTLWPFVLLRDKSLKANTVLVNHERIHLRQQIQLLIVPFYVWYGVEFICRLVWYKDRKQAYKNLSMEREAYTNESNLEYLKAFKFWAFLTYL